MSSGAETGGTDADFDAYVHARWPRLVRTAVLLGASPSEAEDVAQEALTQCLLKWDRVSAAENRDAYVHRLLVNRFTSMRRRRWWGERPTEHLPEVPLPDATAEVDEADFLGRAVAALPDAQRAVVVLRYYAHLGEAETAEALGVAVGTVKSRTSRALAALAAHPALIEERGR